MIQVIEKNEGTKLNYEVVGTKLFLGDDEIMVNLAKYEKDEPVHIDVVRNWDGALATSIGKSDDLSYAAQIDIPARAYTGSGFDQGRPTGHAVFPAGPDEDRLLPACRFAADFAGRTGRRACAPDG